MFVIPDNIKETKIDKLSTRYKAIQFKSLPVTSYREVPVFRTSNLSNSLSIYLYQEFY